jgi:hypothetical protein
MGYVKDLLQSMRQVSSFGNAKDIRLTTSSLMECVSMIFCRVSLLGILNSFFQSKRCYQGKKKENEDMYLLILLRFKMIEINYQLGHNFWHT